jgi:predicted Rossmann-fold nucleotide-binding protein
MSAIFRIDRAGGVLYDPRGRTFDPRQRGWSAKGVAPTGDAIDAAAAVAWLQRESGVPIRVPVGVIGPREATVAQLAAAEGVGQGLAAMGLAVVCGGRQGVMEAVCRGATSNGGITIGLLPEGEPT